MDYDVKELTAIAKARGRRLEALRAELSEAKKEVTDMETRALEAEAERDELITIIERMDEVCPKADHTCDEPGITLSEAVRRERLRTARSRGERK